MKHPSILKNIDVRPADYYITDKYGNKRINSKKYNVGDCSTRCLAYALKGDYNKIEAEQYRLAKVMNCQRNTSKCWSQIAMNKGYVWIWLGGKKNRAAIATMLKDAANPIITHSRGHVCCVDGGYVIDTWDSTAGQVDNIMVHKTEAEKIIRTLNYYGFSTEYTRYPKVVVKHYRRRCRYW